MQWMEGRTMYLQQQSGVEIKLTRLGQTMVPRLRDSRILASSVHGVAFHATHGPFFSRSLYDVVRVAIVIGVSRDGR